MSKTDGLYSRDKRNVVLIMLLIALILCTLVLSYYCFKINNIVNLYKDKYDSECAAAMFILKSNTVLSTNTNEYKQNSQKLDKANSELKKQNEQIRKKLEALQKKNQQLEASKKELAGENLELQKTLKKAAASGITPQSYSIYSGDSLENLNTKGKYLGKFVGTAYTPSSEECGNSKGITSCGLPIVPGVSIAVDKEYWPYGTIFYIKGLGYTVAMDTGSAIKGKNRFDFAVLDKKFAYALGQEKYEVYLVKMGTGKVDKTMLF